MWVALHATYCMEQYMFQYAADRCRLPLNRVGLVCFAHLATADAGLSEKLALQILRGGLRVPPVFTDIKKNTHI